jgi:hypothetical protein
VIIFDSSYLVVLLHPNPAPAKDRDNKPVTQFQERVAYLAATMDVSNDTIGIPTPAMAEVLVRSGSARAKYVSILSDRLKFQIIPFDSRAAIEAKRFKITVKRICDLPLPPPPPDDTVPPGTAVSGTQEGLFDYKTPIRKIRLED